MSVATICQILRDLDRLKFRSATDAMGHLEKWLYKMRPSRRHQTFSWREGRYVDEGE